MRLSLAVLSKPVTLRVLSGREWQAVKGKSFFNFYVKLFSNKVRCGYLRQRFFSMYYITLYKNEYISASKSITVS